MPENKSANISVHATPLDMKDETFICWQGKDMHANPARNFKHIIINVNAETKAGRKTVPTKSGRLLLKPKPQNPPKLQQIGSRACQNLREHSLKSTDSSQMTTGFLQLSFTGFQLQLLYIFMMTYPGPFNTGRTGLR